MTDAEEAEVVAWLEGEAQTKIETGCAWVFLAGDTAFKVKKRVDLGFLDYSTLDLRRWALERELRFNRAATSDIYRAVRTITRKSGGGLELKEATLYTAFRRLEAAGCIRSYWGDEQSGARRRYYSLTDEGLEKLLKDCETWRETRQVLDQLLGGESK